MKFKFKYTQDNGNELAIAPLRENYMITVGKNGRYNSVLIPKRTLIDVLLKMAQELANDNSETAKIS